MSLQALIFDVDGTLANTERDAHLAAFNQAFATIGLDWHWSNELYHELLKVTGGKERIKHYITDYLEEFDVTPYAENVGEFAKIVHAIKTENFISIISAGDLPLRTGVERLLREAKSAGLKLAIATTTTPANVDAIITHSIGKQWLDHFEIIAAGDMVPNKKPAGDIYTLALEHMGLEPEEALAFEDSQNGIHAATDAGLKSIITVNSYTATHSFDDALVVLSDLGEPNHAFTVLAGAPTEHTYVNVAYLQELHQNYYG